MQRTTLADICVAPIAQLRTCVIKIVIFKGGHFLSFFLYILPDPLSSIIGRCTLYTPGCRMKAYK